MKYLAFILVSILGVNMALAQPTTYPTNGAPEYDQTVYAFKNARIHMPKGLLENGVMLVQGGKIIEVGTGVSIPKGAVVRDLWGQHVYPSFIELYANYGLPAAKPLPRNSQMLSNKQGAYSWNEALKPEYNAAENFVANTEEAKKYIKAGFGLVVTHAFDGIARGTGALVQLNAEKENLLILKGMATANYSFKKGSSIQDFPSSLMGAIALLRQTWLDAQWHQRTGYKTEKNLSLEAWNKISSLPSIFDTRDRLEALRAAKIAKEFNVNLLIKGSGDEYMRLDALKATGYSFIIPVNYPKAYDLSNPLDAELISLADMKHWELAPSNAAKLAEQNIPFAFTSDGLEDKSTLIANIQKAVKRGLKKEKALDALTLVPAQLLGVEKETGSLEKGKYANFLISSGEIFDEKTEVLENWVMGKEHKLGATIPTQDIRGGYQLTANSTNYTLEIGGEMASKLTYKIIRSAGDTATLTPNLAAGIISFSLPLSKDPKANVLRFTGSLGQDGLMYGKFVDPQGNWGNWTTQKQKPFSPETKKPEEKKEPEIFGTVLYPFVGYGNTLPPNNAKTYLIKKATVWTSEKEGILKETDVLVQNGKIQQIGKNLTAGKDVLVIEAEGKHLTPGLIDEHSHIAISRGVNEGTQSSSAEVSIADVVNSEDVNIYRHLAGGITCSQLLHGSANAIGGQSAIIKLRWGLEPEAMKLKNAPGFIKFALGENVKQSNWGDNNRWRFPQTRMGVEQVYVDHFNRALQYEKQGSDKRKDLEMECLVEILNKKRFITCHSYVQSEINMLMKVAEQFNFRINTFTHILEGYKIADKMKQHGVGASTFSDWWAYKMEVLDAIPYNAAILNKMGICTAINSDDAEMARRLNQEASKLIKYGNMSEEDALKTVTLNPAKLLHLDSQLGSIKVGKDADLVLWSENPLSNYAKALKTWVDGMLLFDVTTDLEKRAFIKMEKARISQKMIGEKNSGQPTQKPQPKHHHHYHCDDMADELQD